MDLTPTQRKILAVLSDGRTHGKKELHACLDDELSSVETVKAHVSMLRKKINAIGQDVMYSSGRNGEGYRLVRLVAPYSAS